MLQDDSSTSSDDAPLVTQDSLPEPTKLRDVCRCKNSKCLKRYCVCFERGDACRDTCECVNCENTKDSAVAKQQRRAAASRKRKVTEGGCTCKKSRCLKRYCDCFSAGIKCVAECKCLDCQNGRPADAPAVEADAIAARRSLRRSWRARLALRVEWSGRSHRRRRGSNELRHGAVRVSFGSLLAQRDQYDTYWGVQSSHAKSASASLMPATTSRERRSRCAVAAAASGRAHGVRGRRFAAFVAL